MHDLRVENVTTIIIHTMDTISLDLTFNRSVIKRKLYRYFPNATLKISTDVYNFILVCFTSVAISISSITLTKVFESLPVPRDRKF